MTTNQEIVFKLIQQAFKNETIQFESSDEKELVKLLMENGLAGLVFHVIDPKSFDEAKYYSKLKAVFNAYIIKDTQQQFIIKSIKESFDHLGVDHIFLKGSHLKALYPQSYMRGMGDIDVLVKKADFIKAIDCLKQLKYQLETATSHHHVFKTPEGQSVELHQSIASINEAEYTVFLNTVWQYAKDDHNHTKKMDVSFEYTYLLIHLIRHLRTSGVGIRSLLDIDVFLKASGYKEDEDVMLSQNKLFNFSQKVKRLNDIVLSDIQPLADDIEAINYIMISGIHGTGSEHDVYISKRVYEQNENKKGKFRFFLQEVFPGRARLQERFPYLKKQPWLLPWAWIQRIWQQLFKPKNTKKRLKSLSSDKNVDKVNQVYQYFGI